MTAARREPVDIASLTEWLAQWGDGPNWADKTGQCVPVAKVTLCALLKKLELLTEIERRAAECRHKDRAAGLVYFINNTVEAPPPAWRSWHCDLHNYGGSGPVNECPRCRK